MDDRKKDQSIQSHANFDGDSATGDRTQIRQDQQNQQPPQIDPSLADAQAVAASLGVDPNTGLSQAEAERRLAQYGPNELASAPPVPKWKKFLAQFKDPLVYLLLAATGISLIAWFIEKANAAPGAEGGEALPFDAIVIVLILIVNAVLGYIQESKAEEAVEALSQMTAPQTNVLRDGKIARINTVDVVPGDVVMLGEGDSIPADGRLLAAASLRVAEASLTGESVPVGKNVDTLAEAKALGDRANMVFNGTSVTQGTGRAIVTSTGMRTQVGKIADLLQATDDDDSPLQKEMNYVSKILGIAVCIIAAVVLVALALTEGFNDIHDVIDSLLLSVSLAVAAVPEGLAAILTVVLALGVRRMAEHHAIVKKLHSVETLGSASVICSDKTGTLTRNEMTVERVVTPSGEVQLTGTGYAPEGRMIAIPDAGLTSTPSLAQEAAQLEAVATLAVGALANDGELRENTGAGDGSAASDITWEAVGDPTEVSLIVAARKVKADRKYANYTRIGEIPFTSDRKRMAVVAQDNADAGRLTVFAKGAPDVLLGYCSRSDVGIVGARLYYEDDTIQHAGVVIGFGGIAGHCFVQQPRGNTGYCHRIICAQDYSAVTAACMMVKRSVFEEVGGLTEELAVAFNDIDFCMKVRQKGYLVVYNPYAELYHYESKSRGLEDTPEKQERFHKEIRTFETRWPEILKNGDPYYNPNLSLETQNFSLKRL